VPRAATHDALAAFDELGPQSLEGSRRDDFGDFAGDGKGAKSGQLVRVSPQTEADAADAEREEEGVGLV